MPTTSGPWSTGDALTLVQDTHASLVDLEKVQIHPTGFINPRDPEDPSKILAGECLRAVGGLLLDENGQRFCDELATRKVIADRMMAMPSQSFVLILSLSASLAASDPHVNFYKKIGLLEVIHGIEDLAQWYNETYGKEVSANTLRSTFVDYQDAAKRGRDVFGKTVFRNVPAEDLNLEIFVVGRVTPVVHYCMGGIAVDPCGRVLRSKCVVPQQGDAHNDIVPGLYAVGEVTGGLHGNNRLGGNSLLECVVFGRVVGDHVPLPTTLRKPSK